MTLSFTRLFLICAFVFVLGFTLAALSPVLTASKTDIKFIAYLAGTVIALCALIFTIWQVRSTIKHNKLTNKPKIQVTIQTLSSDNCIHVYITNNGLGPAEIINSEYSIDSKPIPHKGIDKTPHFLEDLFSGFGVERIIHGSVDDGTYIPSGESEDIFKVIFIEGFLMHEKNVRSVWDRINNRFRIYIEYKSIYNEIDYVDEPVTS